MRPKIRLSQGMFDRTGLSAERVKALRLIIVAVMGGVVWANITGGVAMTGYLKELQASDFLYGVVIALSPIASSLQFLASFRLERTLKRKRMFVISGLIQRSIWVLFGLIPFFIPMTEARLRLAAAVLCAAVSAGMNPFMNVTFYSICADVVPLNIRGRYFASRSRISTAAGLIAGLLVGYLLDALPGFTGYAVVFALASVAGVFDVFCYMIMPVPEMKRTPQRVSMRGMIGRVLTNRNYMRIVLGMTVWNFTVQLSSPYYNVYMRDVLNMSNMSMIVLGQITSNLFLILFVGKWGRAMDRYGNKPVLTVAAVITSFYCFVYAFAGKGSYVMMFLANALSGATYCAIDLSAQNLFLGQADERNQSMYFAIYSLFTSLLGLALGSAAGGYLLDHVLAGVDDLKLAILGVDITRYNALFFFSGFLRLFTALLLLGRVREDGAKSEKELARAMLPRVLRK